MKDAYLIEIPHIENRHPTKKVNKYKLRRFVVIGWSNAYKLAKKHKTTFTRIIEKTASKELANAVCKARYF